MNETKYQKKRRSRNALDRTDVDLMVYGKIPPQAADLEAAVLGAMMLEPRCIDKVIEVLKWPHVFYKDAHQRIFKAIIALIQKSAPVDCLTVKEQLHFQEELDLVGGFYVITKLTESVVSGANAEYHSRIIFQKYVQREMIRVAGEMIAGAYEDNADPFELMEEVEAGIFEVTNILHRKSYMNIAGLVTDAIIEMHRRRENVGELTGVTSGFTGIDSLTNGWQNTDLIILAARPSVGKTALALNLARNAAAQKKPVPVAFFSLEMSAGQLTQRLVAAEAEVSLERMLKGKFDDMEAEHVYSRAKNLVKMPLFIDDTPGLNIIELRAKCRKLKALHGIGLIIIDYLQLMSGMENRGGGNREQEISAISRSLKALAKELNVPIIALSQLSREVEKRSSKIPQLSDLRESGAIEQDADSVVFIYRPEYHGIGHNEMGDSTKGETHLRWAKHRNGAIDFVKLQANLVIQKFYDFEGPKYPANFTPGIDFKNLAANDNFKHIGQQVDLSDDFSF